MKREETELQVFDLLETKDFDTLSAEERSLVLSILSESEYQLQRRIIVESEGSEEIIAGPLVLPTRSSVVPIWVASLCSAAAAAIIVFLMMFSEENIEVREFTASPTVIHDTLIVENKVTDTIVDYKIIRLKPSIQNKPEANLVQVPEVISGAPNVPPMREEELVNSGVSAANDATAASFKVQPFLGM
ncbi:MAG: hypothetical protein ACFHU9_18025 [Fluviicola sp.]